MKYEGFFHFSWHGRLIEYLYSDKFESVVKKAKSAVLNKEPIYPSLANVFNAYKYTPYENVKVVILGIEPYPADRGNNGFAFSTTSLKTPYELEVIFKEIRRTVPIKHFSNQDLFCGNDLIQWAKQGVLLLNIRLTVRETASSHSDFGWEELTIKTIQQLNETPDVIYFLWGSYAQSYRNHISNTTHIFEANHPATERYDENSGFYQCNHFEEANKILKAKGKTPINWLITPNYYSAWEIYFNEEIVYYLPTYYNALLAQAFGPQRMNDLKGKGHLEVTKVLNAGIAKLWTGNGPKKDEVFRNTSQSLAYHLGLIVKNIAGKEGFFNIRIDY